MAHNIYQDITVNAEFEITKLPAKNLSFTKLNTTKNLLTEEDILKQISKGKDGYALKSISAILPNDAAVLIKTPKLSLKIKKAGNFTANIVLTHPIYLDTTITGIKFEIKKLPTKKLSFTKLRTNKNFITKEDILKQITGVKDGYSLKNILAINPNDVAELTGVSKLSLKIKKTGNFTANIVLAHPLYLDITGAKFEITKGIAKNLSFPKLISNYKNIISKETILNQITGLKNGYTLKSISNLNPNNIAELTGTPKLSLRLKKIGNFTATIVLAHPLYSDAIITGAMFEIKKLPAKKLSFTKLSTDKNIISKEDILKQITGIKDGYTLQSISEISGIYMAELTGISKLSLSIKKVGNFTATIVLTHPLYLNATITGAEFEIQHVFNKLSIPYKSIITATEIEKQVPKIIGYTLKSISSISHIDIAELTGSSKTSIYLKKVGNFNMTVTLAKVGNKDIIIHNAQFEITKLPKKYFILLN